MGDRKKPAAFGMDTYDGQKDIKEKDQGEERRNGRTYTARRLCVLRKRKVAKASVTSDHTNISSHGSLADYSALSSTPSLMNENASG